MSDLGVYFVNERDAPPPQSQAEMQVVSWRLMKAPAGDLHLATLRAGESGQLVVRVTSPIAQIRYADRSLTTSSGRHYLLLGPPESKPLECQTLRLRAASMGLSAAIDVSDQHWQQMQ